MKNCKHASCGEVCKYPPKEKKVHRLRRKTPIKKTVIKPKLVKIKKISKKQIVENFRYSRLRKKFMKSHPMCECGRDGCNREATEVHHKRGRGEFLLVVSTWLAVNRICHRWIHDNQAKAVELGLLDSRLTSKK